MKSQRHATTPTRTHVHDADTLTSPDARPLPSQQRKGLARRSYLPTYACSGPREEAALVRNTSMLDVKESGRGRCECLEKV
jgi:hypothetical protein